MSLDDEEWEQWLKNVIESGGLPFLSEHLINQSSNEDQMSRIPQALFPRMMDAARAGNWRDIPETFHDMLRRTLECETPIGRDAYASANPQDTISRTSRPQNASAASQWRRPYSSLSLARSEGRSDRTAQPGA